MTVWILIAMFATGPLHYELYGRGESCDAQVKRLTMNRDDVIAYCTKRVVAP